MLGILIEDGPREQLLSGALFLLAGLVIFPAILSFLMPVVEWMNQWWSETAAWQAGWLATKVLMIFACALFVIVGAGRLAVSSFVKAGLMHNPWT